MTTLVAVLSLALLGAGWFALRWEEEDRRIESILAVLGEPDE